MTATANRALDKADKKIAKLQQREEKMLETVAELKDKLQNVKAELDESFEMGFQAGFAKAKDQLLAILQKNFGGIAETGAKKRGRKPGAKSKSATKTTTTTKTKTKTKTKSTATKAKGKRGRPSKKAVVSGVVEVKQVKRRGRPRKSEMVTETQAEAA
jgi:hypothetical protein